MVNKRIGLAVTLSLLTCLGSFALAQAVNRDAFTFFIPYLADTLDDQFDVANDLNFKGVSIDTTTSISVYRSGSVIYYDHWEDGLEPNITVPSQVSTQVWGDGILANGLPPGFTNDVLTAGDVVALRNLVPVEPRDLAVLLFDGGDKIVVVGGSIAVTLVAWPETVLGAGNVPQPGILFAGAWELYPTSRWGTQYVIPVGQNVTRGSGSFRIVGINIQAVDDGTLVDVDADADGVFEITGYVLNEGEQLTQLQGIIAGAHVRASAPVQVHTFTGNPASRYEARADTMIPRDQWTNNYLAPRSSDGDYWLHNPHDTELVVAAETIASTTLITIPARSTAKFPPVGLSGATGVHFTAADDFFGLVTLDQNDEQDWGYSLQPVENLTTQTLVGWAPGNNNNPPDGDESRIYVTAIDPTTVVVDYDNDGTPDAFYPVSPLAEVPITDPDHDLTGARLYTENGVPFIAVWGQDQNAPPALPSIDVGTDIVPLLAPSIQKVFQILEEGYDCGAVTREHKVRFQLLVYNDGADAFLDVVVRDDLSPGTGYVPGSTAVDGSPVTDDGSGTPFPLDEGGYNVGTIAGFGQISIAFDATIRDPGVYNNRAEIVSPPADPASVDLSLPFRQAGYEISKTLLDPPQDPISPGQVITFGLTITNTGGTTITHFPLRDVFDGNFLIFRSASLTPNVVAAGEVRWDDVTTFIGDLGPGALVNLWLSFSAVDPLPAGETSTFNAVLTEGVRDEFDHVHAIQCDEAVVRFNVPAPAPTPTSTPRATATPTNGGGGTPTSTPPATPSIPSPTSTPVVLFLPETGSGRTPTYPWWHWLALPR